MTDAGRMTPVRNVPRIQWGKNEHCGQNTRSSAAIRRTCWPVDGRSQATTALVAGARFGHGVCGCKAGAAGPGGVSAGAGGVARGVFFGAAGAGNGRPRPVAGSRCLRWHWRARFAGRRFLELLLFVLGQRFVLCPHVLERLALLGRRVLNVPVACAGRVALFRRQFRPVPHPGLDALLLIGAEFRISVGDLEPLLAAGRLEVVPLAGQVAQGSASYLAQDRSSSGR